MIISVRFFCITNVDLLIKCFQVLNEDIVKCHVRSHISSLYGNTKEIDSDNRKAKVRIMFPKVENNNTPLFCHSFVKFRKCWPLDERG